MAKKAHPKKASPKKAHPKKAPKRAAGTKMPPPSRKGGPARAPSHRPVGGAGAPAVQDVNTMPVVSPAEAAQIKAAAGVTVGARPAVAQAAVEEAERVVKPGTERWPVKTGSDADVGKVVPKIVPATVEEMISIPRPSDIPIPSHQYKAYQNRRESPVETTIWRIEAHITALKQETDGDYHLVLQGASGETMIAEVPMPQVPFVTKSCPWLANITAARAAVADKLLKHVSTAAFVPMKGKLVPRESLTVQPEAAAAVAGPLATADAAEAAFKTRIDPVAARVTGVGFFDSVHGQMGVSLANGIELHPVLKIEWL
jgi:hypothetical protein